jgi:hypothetical protein
MNISKSILIVILIVWVVIFFAVAGMSFGLDRNPAKTSHTGLATGYKYQIGEAKIGNFETAPYLPRKIRFWVEKNLDRAGLLSPKYAADKQLIINIEVRARYVGRSWNQSLGDDYMSFDSHVEVLNSKTNEVVAKRVVRAYGSGADISDAVELYNAKEIAEFLEEIVQ